LFRNNKNSATKQLTKSLNRTQLEGVGRGMEGFGDEKYRGK